MSLPAPIDVAVELLGIPVEYVEPFLAEFTAWWGGTDLDACERALVEGVPASDAYFQAFAIFALGSTGTSHARHLLLPLVEHDEPLLRLATGVCLGYLREPHVLPLLQEMLVMPPLPEEPSSDQDQVIQSTCEGLVWGCIPEILGGWGDRGSAPALRQALATLIQIQAGKRYDPYILPERQHSLVYHLGRLKAWQALTGLDVDDLSLERWQLLLVMGALHERLLFGKMRDWSERMEQAHAAPEPLPAHLYPELTLGRAVEYLLRARLGLTGEQAQALLDRHAGDVFPMADALAHNAHRHERLFSGCDGVAGSTPMH